MAHVKTFTRWLLALICVGLVVVNGLIPFVWQSQYTDPYVYSLLSGADSVIAAYLENALFTVPILVIVMGLFGFAAFRFVRRRAKAARPVMIAVGLIVLSLVISDHRGLTSLHLNPGEMPLLIGAMGLFVGLSLWAGEDGSDMP